jgi:hypothetical protein
MPSERRWISLAQDGQHVSIGRATTACAMAGSWTLVPSWIGQMHDG